jgi:hypothetical protein
MVICTLVREFSIENGDLNSFILKKKIVSRKCAIRLDSKKIFNMVFAVPTAKTKI